MKYTIMKTGSPVNKVTIFFLFSNMCKLGVGSGSGSAPKNGKSEPDLHQHDADQQHWKMEGSGPGHSFIYCISFLMLYRTLYRSKGPEDCLETASHQGSPENRNFLRKREKCISNRYREVSQKVCEKTKLSVLNQSCLISYGTGYLLAATLEHSTCISPNNI
jgi:hypothetical protein